MPNRNKIIIGLLAATLALGSFIFIKWLDNDDTIERFRTLLLNHPRQLVAETTVSFENTNTLWYGGISLVAVVMAGLAIMSISGVERRVFRERLVAMEVLKAELETSLQDSVWREKHAHSAREAAVRELKELSSQFAIVQRQASDNHKLVVQQERELKVLRSQGRAGAGKPIAATASNIHELSALREELRERTELLQVKDTELNNLEKKVAASVGALQSQLDAKEKQLKQVEQAAQALKSQLAQMEAAKRQLESGLTDQLKKEKQAAAAKEAAIKELERKLNGELRALNLQLNEKQELIRAGAAEQERLKAELNQFTSRLADKAAAGERAEKLLQQEIEKKDTAFTQLENEFKAKTSALEAQLRQKDGLFKERDSALDSVKVELAALQSAKTRSDDLLRLEVGKAKEALDRREREAREHEEKFTQTVDALEAQLKQQQDLLSRRDGELAGLKSEVAGLRTQLAGMNAAVQQTKIPPKPDLSPVVKQLEEKLADTVRSFQSQLDTKEKQLKQGEQAAHALRSQLAEIEAAKSQLESGLADELKKEQQAAAAKETAIKELERKLNGEVRTLNFQLNEKQELIKAGAAEQERLKAELKQFTDRLADRASSSERAEKLLQQEIEKNSQFARENDAAMQKLERELNAKIVRLETQLSDKDTVFKERDAELDSVRLELAALQSAKAESEASLRQELANVQQALASRDSKVRASEEKLTETTDALEQQLKQREDLLRSRDKELAGLKSDITGLLAQIASMDAAVEQAQVSNKPDLSIETSPEELEQSMQKIQALEILLADKDELLKTHDEKIVRLESELKEKRMDLARREIAVWQKIQRRDAWKHRLSKFGVKLKD